MTRRSSSLSALGAAVLASFLICGCKEAPEAGAPTAPGSAETGRGPVAVVSGVTPSEVKAGEAITVSGTGFGGSAGSSVLSVGGVAATSILSWTDTEITAIVPAAAMTGDVTTKVGGAESAGKPVVVLWDAENPDNVVVGGNRASPLYAQLMEDGLGGTFVVWNDYRSYDPTSPDPAMVAIHAQRLNSRGKVLWSAGGVPLSTVPGGQWFPQLVSDGSGGAIVVWQDHRGSGSDVYAQRISRTGELLWAAEVPVCAAAGDQEKPQLVSDGAGGAIVVWQDHRSGSQYEVYAQRIDGSGVPRWAADGVAVSTAAGNPQFLYPEVASDGAGGAIVVWQDLRSGEWFLYAQRLDAEGAARWTSDGLPVSTSAASYQYGLAQPLADGEGGVIVVWEGSGAWTATGSDLLAQRIDATGAPRWGAAGTVVSAAPGDQTVPRLAIDGAGGAIVAWEDCRVGSAYRDVYAQRLSGAGAALWTADGVPVGTSAASQFGPRIISDGRGGAIVAWYDYRSYDLPSDGTIQGVDAYAQRLDGDGVAQWAADGAAISTARLHQMYPEIVSDHAGGAILLWEDSRTSTEVQLFAQGISFGGRQ